MEKVLLERIGELGEKEYLVKWLGYEDPTWTAAENLSECMALDEYENIQNMISELPPENSPEALIATAISSPNTNEPLTYSQAMNLPNASHWKKAITSELNSLYKNETWEPVDNLPLNAYAINSQWIFKIKHFADGSINKFKARLVARGFTQRPGIDFDETYSPVVKFVTL